MVCDYKEAEKEEEEERDTESKTRTPHKDVGKTHTATLSYPASVFMALWTVLLFIIYVTVLCIFTEGMNLGMPMKAKLLNHGFHSYCA